MLSYIHIITIIFTLLLVTLLGGYSMTRVKSASDFSVGGRSLSLTLVAGTIAGTLIGGASTVGTAQLAFQYGFSAWWFTLGCGIASIILGLFLANPLRKSGASTGPGFLAQAYGSRAGTYACLFTSIGIFLNIVGNILATMALLTSVLGIKPLYGAYIAVFLVITYVIFGGVWGTGMVGILKIFLIYLTMLTAGLLAYSAAGGWEGLTGIFPAYPWFSLFGRGVEKDLAGGFSMLVGVISTQTYLQAIFSGESIKASRNGALLAGLIAPPLGLAGIFVGLYMRAAFPSITAAEALPLFILKFFPHWLGGIALAALLISSIGTAAGLVLGVSTMISQDIYKKSLYPRASDSSILLFSRASIIAVMTLALFFVSGNLNSLILKWSILSMGLRGATLCFPLLFAIFCKGCVRAQAAILALFLAPSATILWAVFGPGTPDPLYIGLTVSIITLVSGSILN